MERSFDIKVYLGCLRQNVYNEHTYVESKFDEKTLYFLNYLKTINEHHFC